jgi:hypothetical protein
MNDLKKAAQQALEALENTTPTGWNMERDKQFFAAITALRAALKQPEPMCVGREGKPTLQNSPCAVCGKIAQQEQGPVAWTPAFDYPNHEQHRVWENGEPRPQDVEYWAKNGYGITCAYTHPPRREPEPPPEPISDAKIRAEFREINRHPLPGDITLEDWFEAGVRYAEKEHAQR